MAAPEAIPKLLFVYAVDGGIFSAMTDYAHKLLSPKTYPCKLCALTYGALGAHRAWTRFLQELPIASQFLHRDEFIRDYPREAESSGLPAVFTLRGRGLEPLLTAAEISKCSDLEALIALLRESVESLGS